MEAQRPRDLLERVLETPDLARVVQGLEPAVLHQLVRTCGLEDCGQIVALASTEQLMRVFDRDLWRNEPAGGQERFDADRFGVWLEVLAEAGADVAARKIVEMDFDLVTAALSHHVLVLDQEAMATDRAAVELGLHDDDPIAGAQVAQVEAALDGAVGYEVSGYLVVAKRGESWDALVSVLTSLDVDHHAFFRKLMSRCCAISTEYIVDNGGLYEVLTTGDQVLDDLASDRDERRGQEGYVAPPMAAAFLKLAREPIGSGNAPPAPDHLTVRYFRGIEERAQERAGEATERRPRPGARTEHKTPHDVRQLLTTLPEAGALPTSPVPLLREQEAGLPDRLARIKNWLADEQTANPAAHARRVHQLGYLANVLIAGCSFQSRRFRSVEAADAALATCNLGLENWPPHWAPSQDLVTVFRVGWSVLHERVALYVAGRLVRILSEMRADDDELHHQLLALRRRMAAQVKAGTPWRERENLDVIAILDPPSWATLLGLVDECPVVPKAEAKRAGAPHRVTTEFEFISENRQIAWAREFAESLPDRLLG
jgi:hypothetical protein